MTLPALRLGSLLLVGAAALLFVAASCASSGDEALSKAPPFRLAKLYAGDSLALDDLRGQYVLMNFWASWCGPCRAEMPALESLHRRFRGTGLTVLGVTINDLPEDSRDFGLQVGTSYMNVIGTDEMAQDYQLTPWIPVTLLIGPEGRILRQWSGPQTEASFLEGIRAAAPELRAAADR